MSADIPRTPVYRRHFEPGQLQFIITSVYCRNRKSTQEPGSSCRYSDGDLPRGQWTRLSHFVYRRFAARN